MQLPQTIYIHSDATMSETASQASSSNDAGRGKRIRQNKKAKKMSALEVLKKRNAGRHSKSHGRRRGHMLFN